MKAIKKEIYISVDVEASGPIPGEYSLLSIGACVVGDPENAFYIELQPISEKFVPAAMEVCGFYLKTLKSTGYKPEKAMERFAEWIGKVAKRKSPVFVGFNACFDWSFVNWYFQKFSNENPFGIGGIDIKAFLMGFSGCRWAETRLSLLPKAFKPVNPQTHNALEDARSQGEIFRKLLASSPPKRSKLAPGHIESARGCGL